MADDETPPVAHDLYALIVYLHAGSNRDLLDVITGEELSVSQVQLLDRLRSRRKRPTVRQAAGMINVSVSATSRLVDQLARRGLIQREGDDDDFRAKRLEITDRGERVIAQLHAARLDQVIRFTDELDDNERAQLASALQPILAREQISQFRPAPVPA